jgi:hypothetical protein
VRDIAEREMQFHEAESYRISGELLQRAGGDPAHVEAWLRHAVKTACRQGAPALEDKARASLVQWLVMADPRRASVEQRHCDELRQRFPSLGRTEETGSAPAIAKDL